MEKTDTNLLKNEKFKKTLWSFTCHFTVALVLPLKLDSCEVFCYLALDRKSAPGFYYTKNEFQCSFQTKKLIWRQFCFIINVISSSSSRLDFGDWRRRRCISWKFKLTYSPRIFSTVLVVLGHQRMAIISLNNISSIKWKHLKINMTFICLFFSCHKYIICDCIRTCSIIASFAWPSGKIIPHGHPILQKFPPFVYSGMTH